MELPEGYSLVRDFGGKLWVAFVTGIMLGAFLAVFVLTAIHAHAQ